MADTSRGPHNIFHHTECVTNGQLNRWGEEVCKIACQLEEWLGMYYYDVTQLHFKERCLIADTLRNEDRDRFMWYAGRNSIPPENAKTLWDNAMENL